LYETSEKIVWFLPNEYYDRNKTFFQHFVHNLPLISLLRNTMVSETRRVCTLKMSLLVGVISHPWAAHLPGAGSVQKSRCEEETWSCLSSAAVVLFSLPVLNTCGNSQYNILSELQRKGIVSLDFVCLLVTVSYCTL
jgi:hypothetical protein